MVYTLLFILTTILVTGSQVVAARNPVYSVFWLVLTFLETAILFIFLQLDFIALMTIIVYVGAIAILFLFVILMLQLDQVDYFPWLPFFPALFLINILIFSAAFLNHIPLNIHHTVSDSLLWTPHFLNNVETIGYSFYQSYPTEFMGAGLILLVAMVGAMQLSKVSSSPWLRQQTAWNQIQRLC